MKKVYEYRSIFDLNKSLAKFERDGYEICIKIVPAGDRPVFYLIADDEKDEKEEEHGEGPDEGAEEKEPEEEEGEEEKKA